MSVEVLAALVTYVLGAWIALRLLRIGLGKLTWRLRNRLIVAYLFIAVLPILLMLTLVALGGYMLAGQVAVYLVRSELDRRLVSLRSVAEDLSATPVAIQRIHANTTQTTFPGLILWTAQNGVRPAVAAGCGRQCAAGIAGECQRRRIAAWTLLRLGVFLFGNQQVLALTPLTRRFLSGLVPGLGDFYFLQRDFAGSSDSTRLLPPRARRKSQ